jgi:hypothetical protein
LEPTESGWWAVADFATDGWVVKANKDVSVAESLFNSALAIAGFHFVLVCSAETWLFEYKRTEDIHELWLGGDTHSRNSLHLETSQVKIVAMEKRNLKQRSSFRTHLITPQKCLETNFLPSSFRLIAK